METKQTAIDWLIDKVEEHFCLLPVDLIEQAKAMEKEQIKESFDTGYSYDLFNGGGEQYYNETYGQT